MRSSAKKITVDPVAAAAQRCYAAAQGDLKKSTALLEAEVRKDRGLRDALTEPLIATACYDAIRKQCHVDRKQIWSPPAEKLVKGKTEGSARVVQLAAGNLLMFPLPGGRKLGEATRSEITEAASFYAKQSGDMATKARWLRLVAQCVTGTKKVSDVLTDKRLRELQKEARHAE